MSAYPPHVDRLLRLVTEANQRAADDSARAHEAGATRIENAYQQALEASQRQVRDLQKATERLYAAQDQLAESRGTQAFASDLRGLQDQLRRENQVLLNIQRLAPGSADSATRQFLLERQREVIAEITRRIQDLREEQRETESSTEDLRAAQDDLGQQFETTTSAARSVTSQLESLTSATAAQTSQIAQAAQGWRDALASLTDYQTQSQQFLAAGGMQTPPPTGTPPTGTPTTGAPPTGSPTSGGSPPVPSLPPPVQLPGSGGSIAIGQPPAQVPGSPIPPGYGGVQLPGVAAAGFSAAEQLSTGTRAAAGSGGTTLSIGNVTIHTQSRNAEELARDLVPALNNELRSNRLQPQLNSNVANRR